MTGYGLWMSAAGMKVSEHRQTLLANNMANMQTVGFKHDLAVIQQRQVESRESPGGMPFMHPVLDGMAGGVNVRPVFHSFGQGPIEQTGRALDVAISGDGFFVVSDGTDTRYTRDGQFTLNTEGELILSSGNGRWKVLDDGGVPIVVDESGGKASIAADGTVRQGDKGQLVVASLGVMTTDDLQTLRKVGENVFKATADMKKVDARFVSQSVEGSTFDVMQGLALMIEATRAYQMNATLIQIQDELTGQATSTVGRFA